MATLCLLKWHCEHVEMQDLKEGEKVPDFKTVFKKIILGGQEDKKELDNSKISFEHDAVDSPKMQQYNFESDVDCSKAINCNLENVIVDFSKAQNYNLENVGVYSSNVQKDILKDDVNSCNEKQIGTGIINQAKLRRFSRKFEEFPNESKQRHYKKEKWKVKMKQTDEIVEKINHILDESSCFSLKKKLPDAYFRDYGEYEEPVSGLTPNKFNKIFEGSGINPYSQKKCNIPDENNVSEFFANADYIIPRKKGETFVSDDKTPDKEKFCTDSRQNSKPSCFYFSKTQREFIEKKMGVQSCHHINEFSQNTCNKLLGSLSISSSPQNTELNIYKSSVLKKEQNMQNSPLLNVSENDSQHFSEEWEIDEYLGVYGAPPEKILTKFPRRHLQWKK